jgi:hypothetical protein
VLTRRLDERGYPQPLPGRLRTRLVRGSVGLGAGAAALVVLALVGTRWWTLAVVLLLGLAPGVLVGLAFAARDRELAVPTPFAAGIAAFVVAFATPFVAFGIYAVLWLIHVHAGP